MISLKIYEIRIVVIILLYLFTNCRKSDESSQIKSPTFVLGVVVDKNTGEEINNAKVLISIYDDMSGTVLLDSTYTNKDGYYEIKEEKLSTRYSLPMDPLNISIIHPNYYNAGTYLEYNAINKYDFKLTKR